MTRNIVLCIKWSSQIKIGTSGNTQYNGQSAHPPAVRYSKRSEERTIQIEPERRNAISLVKAKTTPAMLKAVMELRAMSRPPLVTSRFPKTVTDGTWRELEPTSNVAIKPFGVRHEIRVTETANAAVELRDVRLEDRVTERPLA